MCGIFGQISRKRKRFDYSAFCTLGINNDIRGGDSCGIFIDGNVEYGVNDKKFFENFFEDSKLLKNTEECQIAFGHCRKASIGGISLETAQPVVLYSKEGIPEFVVMHNGTIYNSSELAKKYIPDIDIKGMTDSQVMARIFYYKGYDVLSEYNGAAVFAIADYRKENPEVLFWQGVSPDKYNGKPTEERPLYFALSDDEVVFSSIYTFLPALRPKAKMLELKGNLLCKYTTEGFKVEGEYSRENQVQYSRGTSYYNYYYSDYYPTYSVSTPASTYKPPVPVVSSSSKIYSSCKDGKCYYKGGLAHGKIKSTLFGDTENTNMITYDMWFWNGTLLKNEHCFNYLSNLSIALGCTAEDVEDLFCELPLYLSPFPYKRTCGGEIEMIDSPISSAPYTGDYYFPFSPTRVTVNSGKYVSQVTYSVTTGMANYLKCMNEPLPVEILRNNFGEF